MTSEGGRDTQTDLYATPEVTKPFFLPKHGRILVSVVAVPS